MEFYNLVYSSNVFLAVYDSFGKVIMMDALLRLSYFFNFTINIIIFLFAMFSDFRKITFS